jgi:dipeptidyl aminopeptidase/acylaminoacyl peptidase
MKFLRPCLLVLAAVSLNIAESAMPPVSAYINYAEIESMKISPDGNHLAYTKRSDKSELLTIVRYPDFSVTSQTSMGYLLEIHRLDWGSNSRVLLQPAVKIPGYRVFKVPTGEIMAFDVDGTKLDFLFGYRAGKGKDQVGHLIKQRESTNTWAEIVDIPLDNSNTALIQTRSYGTETDSSSLQRLDIRNGRLSRLAGSPVRLANYVTNSKHQPLFVTGETVAGEVEVYWYKPDDKSWQLVATSELPQAFVRPFAQSTNPNEFLALNDVKTSTSSVIAWNPFTREQRVLFHSAVSDARVEDKDPDGNVWIYSYDDHYPGYWYPDPDHPLARAHHMLRTIYKNANVSFTSETRDMSLAVAQVSTPQMPPVFLLIDVKNLKILKEHPGRPSLKEEDLSPTEPIEVSVRDGMKIRGFLTIPRGSAGKNLPMVVVVHGGPHGSFDRYDFDGEVQLFASRGYAVLQVNFRGSGGRGREFTFAGYRRWGREMQNDITDAVQWAVENGTADANRLCIFGASYGAYAALTGAYREPDMFKCAIGMSGVYDLPLLFEKGDIQTRESGLRYLREAVGTDMKDMRSRSPVYNANKIKAAVMLIHGKEDRRAPFEHAKRMRAALKKAGNKSVWISEAGEEHGILNENNRAQVYSEMLEFLQKNLGK